MWSGEKSATADALANSLAEFLAYGPKAADFGKFLDGLKPSEGVAALVLEPAGRRKVRAYAHFSSGRWSADGEAVETIRQIGHVMEGRNDRTPTMVERTIGEAVGLPKTLIKALCETSK